MSFKEEFPSIKNEVFTLDKLRKMNMIDGFKELIFKYQV